MKDIAESTGFTINTVSLALRNSPKVREETKRTIQRIAREMGYVHNALAGSLRSGSSFTVAIVLGDISNLHFAIKIHELEVGLREHGYQVMVLGSDEDADLELAAVKTAISRQVDGVIICPCQKSRESLELLDRCGTPYVLIGRHFGADMDAVVWDDTKGSFLATDHLVQQGCRSILFLNATDEISSSRERAEGYRRAIAHAGLTPHILSISPMAGDVQRGLDSLYAGRLMYDGILAFSDLLALEAACWLEDHGLSVPGDVKMVGFDNILSHIRLPFPLTSISADKFAERDRVVEILLQNIRDGERGGEKILHKMDVWLVPRGSSQA